MGKKRIITKSDQLTEEKVAVSRDGAPRGGKKQVIKGVAHIFVSHNNTIITISDLKGGAAVWASAGSLGFKGARKSTPYAATMVAKNVLEKSRKIGLIEITIKVSGIGPGREAAIRSLIGSGLSVAGIIDDTPLAHNGVRPAKPRRV